MKKQEKPNSNQHPLLNLLINIVIPAVIMLKFSKPEYLGPLKGLIVALVFPFSYGIYDFIVTRKINLISALGLVSIMLTGCMGLFRLPPIWVAFKEASVPLIIGLFVIFSSFSKQSLLKKFFYNDMFLDTGLIEKRLDENKSSELFESLLRRASLMLSVSFFISSALNFGLAVYLVKSAPGTVQYTQELGKMTALSFPVIALPSMVLVMLIFIYMVKRIGSLTGLKMDEVMKG